MKIELSFIITILTSIKLLDYIVYSQNMPYVSNSISYNNVL